MKPDTYLHFNNTDDIEENEELSEWDEDIEPNEEYCPICGYNKALSDDICPTCGCLTR